MLIPKIYDVEGIEVREDVFTKKFACDLLACKGACCTFESDFGAPIREEEIDAIEKTLPQVLPDLPEEHRAIIERDGFYEVKSGELLLRSYEKRACVFVRYEGDIAKCAIEQAYFAGRVEFRKPISCHLFPIRITRFGKAILRFEEFSECKPALSRGESENIRLVTFVKESLVREYGEEWYESFMAQARRIHAVD